MEISGNYCRKIKSWVIDLSVARNMEAHAIYDWAWIYIGHQTSKWMQANPLIYLGSIAASPFNPDELKTHIPVDQYNYLYINNDAAQGEYLVLYFSLKGRESILHGLSRIFNR